MKFSVLLPGVPGVPGAPGGAFTVTLATAFAFAVAEALAPPAAGGVKVDLPVFYIRAAAIVLTAGAAAAAANTDGLRAARRLKLVIGRQPAAGPARRRCTASARVGPGLNPPGWLRRWRCGRPCTALVAAEKAVAQHEGLVTLACRRQSRGSDRMGDKESGAASDASGRLPKAACCWQV